MNTQNQQHFSAGSRKPDISLGTKLVTVSVLALSMAACGGGNSIPAQTSDNSDVLPVNAVNETAQEVTAAPALPVIINSASTTGFSAQILDDGQVALSWVPLSNATRYEVFNGDQLVTSTTEPQTVITPTVIGEQSFEIRAIDDEAQTETIAEGLVIEITEVASTSASQPEQTQQAASPQATSEQPELGAANSADVGTDSVETNPAENTAAETLNTPAATDSIASEPPATDVAMQAPSQNPDTESATADTSADTSDGASEDTSTNTSVALESDNTAVTEPQNETEVASVVTQPDAATHTDTEATPEAAAANVFRTSFTSHTDAGFSGEVQSDGSVILNWNSHTGSTGYNVFRDSEYYVTVQDNTFHDRDVTSTSHYYQVDAFDSVPTFTTIAEGLTVDFVGGSAWDAARSPDFIGNSDYQLVFNEEFDGSELDLGTWDTQYLWGPDLVINSEEQYYVDIENDPDFGFNPFSVNDGVLTIESIQTPDNLLEKANGQRYLSGVITSHSAFKFTYGYIEARAKLPRGRGFWSAFWLLTAYYVGSRPEIDIMEHIGHDWDWAYHTYHYFDDTDTLRSTKSQETVGVDYTNDFHTFGVEWLPGRLVFYVDGIARHTVIDPEVSSQEMYLIANTAIGGWWPGSPDTTTPWPGQHQIDYIRVYQKSGPLPQAPQNDDGQGIPRSDEVPFRSPNHIPSPSQWPEGYPNLLR